MANSSINIEPVKIGSEAHNNREKELDYVRKDLSYLNSYFEEKSIKEVLEFVTKNCKEKTGRTLQQKATPIREVVLLISEDHTAENIRKLGHKLEQRFGIKTIQAYCHKDEGAYDKDTKEWKSNLHAHMVFDWTDHKTGKSIKLNKHDMVEMQTIVADELGLTRGKASDKKHLNALQFKIQKAEEELKQLHQTDNLIKTSKIQRSNANILLLSANEKLQMLSKQEEVIDEKFTSLVQLHREADKRKAFDFELQRHIQDIENKKNRTQNNELWKKLQEEKQQQVKTNIPLIQKQLQLHNITPKQLAEMYVEECLKRENLQQFLMLEKAILSIKSEKDDERREFLGEYETEKERLTPPHLRKNNITQNNEPSRRFKL